MLPVRGPIVVSDFLHFHFMISKVCWKLKIILKVYMFYFHITNVHPQNKCKIHT